MLFSGTADNSTGSSTDEPKTGHTLDDPSTCREYAVSRCRSVVKSTRFPPSRGSAESTVSVSPSALLILNAEGLRS